MAINEGALTRYEAFEQSKPTRSYIFRTLDADLAVVGQASLYDLADVGRRSARAAKNLVEGVERAGASYPPMSPERSACERLAQRARDLAADDALRAEYDAWLDWNAARAILADTESTARQAGGQLTPVEVETTAYALAPHVGEHKDAKLLLEGFCQRQGIKIAGRASDERRPSRRDSEKSRVGRGRMTSVRGEQDSQAPLPPSKYTTDEAKAFSSAADDGVLPKASAPGSTKTPSRSIPVAGIVLVIAVVVALIGIIVSDSVSVTPTPSPSTASNLIFYSEHSKSASNSSSASSSSSSTKKSSSSTADTREYIDDSKATKARYKEVSGYGIKAPIGRTDPSSTTRLMHSVLLTATFPDAGETEYSLDRESLAIVRLPGRLMRSFEYQLSDRDNWTTYSWQSVTDESDRIVCGFVTVAGVEYQCLSREREDFVTCDAIIKHPKEDEYLWIEATADDWDGVYKAFSWVKAV